MTEAMTVTSPAPKVGAKGSKDVCMASNLIAN